jgi:hypothetical protein
MAPLEHWTGAGETRMQAARARDATHVLPAMTDHAEREILATRRLCRAQFPGHVEGNLGGQRGAVEEAGQLGDLIAEAQGQSVSRRGTAGRVAVNGEKGSAALGPGEPLGRDSRNGPNVRCSRCLYRPRQQSCRKTIGYQDLAVVRLEDPVFVEHHMLERAPW